jgi:Phosphoenolpyruvate phosphomutase
MRPGCRYPWRHKTNEPELFGSLPRASEEATIRVPRPARRGHGKACRTGRCARDLCQWFRCERNRRGQPDFGVLTQTEMFEHIRRICRVTTVPVFADADTGYGGPRDAQRAIELWEEVMVACDLAVAADDATFGLPEAATAGGSAGGESVGLRPRDRGAGPWPLLRNARGASGRIHCGDAAGVVSGARRRGPPFSPLILEPR